MAVKTLDRDAIFKEVEGRILSDPDLKVIPASAACFYFAVFAIENLREKGVRAILQAGTAGWPRIRPEQDDGVCPTHFSYVWSPLDPASRIALMQGLMPEVHVWAAIPETGEIVDFTSGKFPEQARKLVGFDWPGDLPPKYLWARKLPKGAYYTATMDATKFVLMQAVRAFGPARAKQLVS
jgi:hypothetical protein